MICHKLRFYGFIASFFFVSLFFTVLFTSNVSATSVSCSGDFSSLTSGGSMPFLPGCDFSSLDSSVAWYYTFSVSNFSLSQNSGSGFVQFALIPDSGNSYNTIGLVSYTPQSSFSGVSFERSFSDIIYTNSFSQTRFIKYRLNSPPSGASYSGSWIYTVSDVSPTPDCPVCETCPVIPENPYDDKFDQITQAIYVCGAILIMLYFFYCIYRMIIKNSGVK